MPTLDFKGKQHIYAHHLTVPYRPLVVDEEKSVMADSSNVLFKDTQKSSPVQSSPVQSSPVQSSPVQSSPVQSSDVLAQNLTDVNPDDNLIIHGDNLHALKALLPRYAGRVKCIYIDPPYNTGNEGWAYNDRVNSPLMREWLKDNSPVDNEDLERHDKWLCMMWPRLHLLRELLSEDGVIFISIDDNEQHHLRMLMDEIFGAENFVSNVIWRKKNAPQNDAKYFSDNHDFVICYANNISSDSGDLKWQRNLLPRTQQQNQRYKFDDGDGRGSWSTDNLSVKTYSPEYDYPVVNPKTGQVHNPPQGRCWITNQETMDTWLAENRVYFGKSGRGRPLLKRYLKDVKQGIVPLTIWDNAEVGSTTVARKAIKQIFSDYERPFDNPKPTGLIDRVLRIATGPNDMILDSFAGSGTTAHAVLELNKEDGGNRKFILVECEDYADTITAERVRRVIKGVPNARDKSLQEGLGGSFTYCTLGEPTDAESMLTGKVLPAFSELAAYLLHTSTGISASPRALEAKNADGLFHSTPAANYYLLYQPSVNYLSSNDAMLNEDHARHISAACKQTGRKAVVFGSGKYIGQRELTNMGITFCQLPYEINLLET